MVERVGDRKSGGGGGGKKGGGRGDAIRVFLELGWSHLVSLPPASGVGGG